MNVTLINASDVVLRLEPVEADPTKVNLVITDTSTGDLIHVVGTPQTLRGLVAEGFSLPVPPDVPLMDDQPASTLRHIIADQQ